APAPTRPADEGEFVPGHTPFPGTELVDRAHVFSVPGYRAPARHTPQLVLVAFVSLLLSPIVAIVLVNQIAVAALFPLPLLLAPTLAWLARKQVQRPGRGGAQLNHFTLVVGLTVLLVATLIVITAYLTAS
ncbi:hypothetical protein, partial [Buchananella hordeovulneris]|uniref:hypothetical protein n=1 Tax=Buchananella hordeovulneris TaxID=52770 RepID=UPI00163A952E